MGHATQSHSYVPDKAGIFADPALYSDCFVAGINCQFLRQSGYR